MESIKSATMEMEKSSYINISPVGQTELLQLNNTLIALDGFMNLNKFKDLEDQIENLFYHLNPLPPNIEQQQDKVAASIKTNKMFTRDEEAGKNDLIRFL